MLGADAELRWLTIARCRDCQYAVAIATTRPQPTLGPTGHPDRRDRQDRGVDSGSLENVGRREMTLADFDKS
jgi:hypothetical protein